MARRRRPVRGPRAKNCGPPWRGKADAMSRPAQRVAERDGPQIQQRVALTVRAEALQQQLRAHLPEYTLIRDYAILRHRVGRMAE
jgi:hypothetical protein